MSHTVTAIFQFPDKSLEPVVLFTGTRERCELIADELERQTALGLNGIRYDGARKEAPAQTVIVVHATEEEAGGN